MSFFDAEVKECVEAEEDYKRAKERLKKARKSLSEKIYRNSSLFNDFLDDDQNWVNKFPQEG
jgi:hypothetical protein